jgi:radical SAM protein with 4Fe4S-binding SPASM domain
VNPLLLQKIAWAVRRKLNALAGTVRFDLEETLEAMALRPFELNLELTNICNADCIFCCYQFQQRPEAIMGDEVFQKAVSDYVAIAGGSVSLTPLVGDALVDPSFLERVRYIRGFPQIDRIFLTTNGILLDRFGIAEILTSGITSIDISTSGFDEDSYKRIYRSVMYRRMRDNVTLLIEENASRGFPVNISIGIRTDRPIEQVMQDPDFQPILKHRPAIDYVHYYSTANGRITPALLSPTMKLRPPRRKSETCANLYNGPTVAPNGDVLACSCFDAMDAAPDLRIGNILEDSLLEIYTGRLMRQLREQFNPMGCLNTTCSRCDSFQRLDLYRSQEGRIRAHLNRCRFNGEVINRPDKAVGISSGG